MTALLLGVWSPQRVTGAQEDRWRERLQRMDSLLRDREYQRASGEAERFSGRILGNLGAGAGARYVLGLTSMFRAIAEMGLGERETAAWYLSVAAAISPGIEQADLTPYGNAAAALRAAAGAEEDAETGTDGQLAGRMELPNCHRQTRAEAPASLDLSNGSPVIVVDVLIANDGSLSRPMLVESGQLPAVEYAALEALRRWRCDPATLGGHPIDVHYQLSVSFR